MKNELYHHGILGQKWGQRNGPPYPLDSGDHSASEKKAGWKKSLNKKTYSDEEIKAARKRYIDQAQYKNGNRYIQNTKGYWRNAPKSTIVNRMRDEDQSQNSFKLTDRQKKYLKIGLAAAGAGVAAYGGYKLYQITGNNQIPNINIEDLAPQVIRKSDGKVLSSEEAEQILEKVKDIKIVDPENKLPKADISGSLRDALKDVNPSNEKDHCQQNSLVACLKYMGVNVSTKSGVWSTSPGSIVDKCFKGSFESKIKEPNLIFDSSDTAAGWIMRRMRPENGSCGTISTKLRGGVDGHAIMWVMEDDKIKFCDPWARTPTGHRSVEDASFYFGSVYSGEHPVISRVDNLELNYDEFFKYFDKN